MASGWVKFQKEHDGTLLAFMKLGDVDGQRRKRMPGHDNASDAVFWEKFSGDAMTWLEKRDTSTAFMVSSATTFAADLGLLSTNDSTKKRTKALLLKLSGIVLPEGAVGDAVKENDAADGAGAVIPVHPGASISKEHDRANAGAAVTGAGEEQKANSPAGGAGAAAAKDPAAGDEMVVEPEQSPESGGDSVMPDADDAAQRLFDANAVVKSLVANAIANINNNYPYNAGLLNQIERARTIGDNLVAPISSMMEISGKFPVSSDKQWLENQIIFLAMKGADLGNNATAEAFLNNFQADHKLTHAPAYVDAAGAGPAIDGLTQDLFSIEGGVDRAAVDDGGGEAKEGAGEGAGEEVGAGGGDVGGDGGGDGGGVPVVAPVAVPVGDPGDNGDGGPPGDAPVGGGDPPPDPEGDAAMPPPPPVRGLKRVRDYDGNGDSGDNIMNGLGALAFARMLGLDCMTLANMWGYSSTAELAERLGISEAMLKKACGENDRVGKKPPHEKFKAFKVPDPFTFDPPMGTSALGGGLTTQVAVQQTVPVTQTSYYGENVW